MQRLTDAELKLMEIIWENNKTASGELVIISNEKLGWKKSTMYTILKKLEDKKMIVNRHAVVSYLISPDKYKRFQEREAIEQYFSGSLPQFVTAFVREKKLNKEEIKELEEVIAEYKEELDE